MFRKKSSAKPANQKGGGGPPPKSAETPSKPAGMDESPEAILAAMNAAAGKSKSSGGASKKGKGGGPMGLVIPLVVVLAIAAVGYFGYTRILGGSIPGLAALTGEARLRRRGTPPEPDAPEDAAQEEGAPPEAAPPEAAPVEGAPPEAELMPDELPDSGSSLSVQPELRAAVDCAGRPAFLDELELTGNAQYSTGEPGVRGVILLAPVPDSDAVSKYQHQSSSSAGFFGAHVVDRDGYAYFAPSPRTGLGIAEATNQDHLYMIDGESGGLTDYLTLPSAAPPSPENPYGVLGLGYDCDSNSLYATTVTGSTAENQVGRIYRIDLSNNEVAGSLDNIDGFGAAVRASANGKQLVFGSPRNSQIRAVDLDADGNFQGEPRTVAQLAESERARQITFANENEMIVQAVEFNFSNPEIPPGVEVRFQYDAAVDRGVNPIRHLTQVHHLSFCRPG